jgi:hypothetical protein
MTVSQLAQRLTVLEKAFEQLKAQVDRSCSPARRWWLEDAGRFADDPVFDEIVRLGQEYRKSLRPGRGNGKRDRP